MPRRKHCPSRLPEGWVKTREFKWNGRHISPGTVLSIKGERGRFRFIAHIKTPTSEWIDVIGGVKGVDMWRSFYPDRIRTVHLRRA